MDGLQDENIKQEDTTDASSSAVEPSFKGRLNIANYFFSPAVKSELISTLRARASQSPSRQEPLNGTSSKPKRKSSSHLSQSPSPRKKSRIPAGYAPPSKYAHLPELRDVITPNLICVFVGLNPGIQTAVQGHAYAHPSNRFWKLLHSSGCTTRLCRPDEDGDLPRLFELGNTNIVSRPTRNGAELSMKEMDDSVEILEEKIRRLRPEAIAVVGKSIWESLWRVKHGKNITKEEFSYGWQDDGERLGVVDDGEDSWEGARVFVATTTSGLAASMPYAEKERIWRELGEWVEQRRSERSAIAS